jgi:hypothetical protein
VSPSNRLLSDRLLGWGVKDVKREFDDPVQVSIVSPQATSYTLSKKIFNHEDHEE